MKVVTQEGGRGFSFLKMGGDYFHVKAPEFGIVAQPKIKKNND